MSEAQPQQVAPKSSRRAGRRNKGHHTPNGTRAVMSDNEASLSADTLQSNGHQGGHDKGRRKSHAHNKGYNSGNASDNPQPTKTQATPIKQAYAGPTFHQSPAASALPLPSFYSRSVPAQTAKPIVEEPTESSLDATRPETSTPTKRESTPLDFLFDAARQARGTPRGISPAAHSGDHSLQSHSPNARSPAPRDADSMFPFELDGGSTPGEDGTPFAATFKDRMDSLKSTRSASLGLREMDEAERRAKSEALKRALMGQSPAQRSPSPHVVDPNNPFNARPPQPHQRSNPTTPSHTDSSRPGSQHQYFPRIGDSPSKAPGYNGAPARYSSNLRYQAASDPEPAELSSDSAISPPRISTARRQDHYTEPYAQHQFPQYGAFSPPPGFHMQPQAQMHHGQLNSPPPSAQKVPSNPGHRSKPSAQQLEHDIRKVLNLNVASNG